MRSLDTKLTTRTNYVEPPDNQPSKSFFYMNNVIRKLAFAYAKTKAQISAFVFVTLIVQSPSFLKPEFQASNHDLLWLSSPVRVGPGRKHRTQDSKFSLDVMFNSILYTDSIIFLAVL